MALLARDALVSIAQRRAAALNYRLQGHNYAAIGKHLGVTANAVQKDVVKALISSSLRRRMRCWQWS
jgi:DNA-directed RNA polymerase specialized sigma24 family protein